jgi:hypothetical protein
MSCHICDGKFFSLFSISDENRTRDLLARGRDSSALQFKHGIVDFFSDLKVVGLSPSQVIKLIEVSGTTLNL